MEREEPENICKRAPRLGSLAVRGMGIGDWGRGTGNDLFEYLMILYDYRRSLFNNVITNSDIMMQINTYESGWELEQRLGFSF